MDLFIDNEKRGIFILRLIEGECKKAMENVIVNEIVSTMIVKSNDLKNGNIIEERMKYSENKTEIRMKYFVGRTRRLLLLR